MSGKFVSFTEDTLGDVVEFPSDTQDCGEFPFTLATDDYLATEDYVAY